MVSRTIFVLFVATIAGQRLAEVRYARRNERALIASGGVEHDAWQVPLMAALHAAWFVSAIVEVWWRAPVFRPALAIAALAAFGAGQTLRLMAMHALGPRWTIRIITLPSAPPVVGGIYRYVRHPNYLGVILEIAALPLVYGAFWTSAAFSAANAALLWLRVRAEERALAADNAYDAYFASRPRFVPLRPPAPPS